MRQGRPPRRAAVRWFVEIGRRLDRKGFIAANDGNLSLLDEDGTLLVTATGARKGYLREDEVVRVDRSGTLLYGDKRPSSELEMHLAVYEERPDVRAVVHAHPPHATAFAVARQPLTDCVLPEVVLTLGSIPIAPYATPGTGELGESIRALVRSHDALLLANHGAITVGADLESAYFVMERLEHSATILFFAQLLGPVARLDADQVRRLMSTGPPEVRGSIPCVPGPASHPTGSPRPSAPSEGTVSSPSPPDLARVIAEVLRGRLGDPPDRS
ncbi:MAG: class II aldolase/adducin family protein [Candidatus Eisenbacteria bacterium]|uniref:Class II aldolase/adducin family protein n=1 Tax=Eiseniibacteriota bacterium TaxID=2212470 RepID=A0A956LY54_UNCEI|nr:class II aldolase/adducin family protein [Candidatus Eisenbacteria bacterium]